MDNPIISHVILPCIIWPTLSFVWLNKSKSYGLMVENLTKFWKCSYIFRSWLVTVNILNNKIYVFTYFNY